MLVYPWLSWLKSPDRRRSRFADHRSDTLRACQLETLESRVLPAVTSVYTAATHTLAIESDAADAISVSVENGNVLVNDVNPDTGLLSAASVHRLLVTGGPGNNIVLLSAVDATNFPSFTGATVNAGAGDDTVVGSEFADEIDGQGGDDLLSGGDGNDQIVGGLGSDTLTGGNGDDLLTDSHGANTILGGDGNDTLVTVADDDLTLTDLLLSGATVTNHLTDWVEAARITGGGGANLLDASEFSGPVELNGEDGNDTLLGGNGNDTLLGGRGRDCLDGADGDDSIRGEHGKDSLAGRAGDDTLHGGGGVDQVLVSANADMKLTDTQATGEGTDSLTSIERGRLIGGNGHNLLDATLFTGKTVLNGRGGNDTLLGGAIKDILKGGEGDDWLQGNDGNDVVNGEAGNDSLNGGKGNDRIIGDDGNDGLSGMDGNDRLFGGAGNDTLIAGAGDDTLFGSTGDDIALGEEGIDDVDGAADTDTIAGGGNGIAADPADIVNNGEMMDDNFMFDAPWVTV